MAAASQSLERHGNNLVHSGKEGQVTGVLERGTEDKLELLLQPENGNEQSMKFQLYLALSTSLATTKPSKASRCFDDPLPGNTNCQLKCL